MKIKFGDILLAVVIIAAALLLLFSSAPQSTERLTAVVIKDNREVKRINLFELPEPITIDLMVGIKIEAENGRIRFAESSCPDKTCIHTGWIDGAGETAVCLPNRVLIKITGEKSSGNVDIIVE